MTDQTQDHSKTYDDWRSDFVNQLWIVFEKATRDAGLHFRADFLKHLGIDLSGKIIRSGEDTGWSLTTETKIQIVKPVEEISTDGHGTPMTAIGYIEAPNWPTIFDPPNWPGTMLVIASTFGGVFPNPNGPGQYEFQSRALWAEEENVLLIESPMTLTYHSPAA